MQKKDELLIFQWKDWEIILKEDIQNETIWANLDQISSLFGRDKSTISRHIKNIFKEEELSKSWTVAFFATVQKEWDRDIERNIEYFNLDMIISVWYRVNSKVATNFRKWATSVLKEHITNWFTINKNRISKNYDIFIQAVEDLKKLTAWKNIWNDEILNLIKSFANTWFNLENFDKWNLPEKWFTKDSIKLEANELYKDIEILKNDLIQKWLATKMFAEEKNIWNLEWIFWNVFASFGWVDLYETIEEKASHLLYFVIKNHPFNDWNKRTWAFCFVWFLQKYNYDFRENITPETLTTLTLLIANSYPKEKERIIWLTLLLLKK